MYFLLWRSTTTTIPQRNSSALLPSEMKEIRVQTSFHYICPYLFLDSASKTNIWNQVPRAVESKRKNRVSQQRGGGPCSCWGPGYLNSHRASSEGTGLLLRKKKGRKRKGTKKKKEGTLGSAHTCSSALKYLLKMHEAGILRSNITALSNWFIIFSWSIAWNVSTSSKLLWRNTSVGKIKWKICLLSCTKSGDYLPWQHQHLLALWTTFHMHWLHHDSNWCVWYTVSGMISNLLWEIKYQTLEQSLPQNCQIMEYHLTQSTLGIDDDCLHLSEELFVFFTLIHFDSQPGQLLHHLQSLTDKTQYINKEPWLNYFPARN